MPRFEPFPAVRYAPDRVDLSAVVAPPYDVIGPEELAVLEGRSPYNVVRVDLARDEEDRDRYESARCRLEEWLAAGVLMADDAASFYVYRMGWRDGEGAPRQTSGVFGLMALDPEGTGQVLPHERTMPKPMDDRLRLMRACQANLSPIWALSLADGLSALCQPSDPPVARCTDDDGVHHRLWRLTAPAALEAIASVVASAPAVIADGHHRYETALAFRAERRAATVGPAGPEDLVLTYVTGLGDGELGVRAIHRLLSGLPDPSTVVGALEAMFDVEPWTRPPEALVEHLPDEGAAGALVGGDAWLLRPRPGTGDPGWVDSERFEAALASLPPHDVTYHHDPLGALALVEKGEAQAALLLRPVTVDDIAAAARAGRRLPQKTTFFAPKPRTGMVIRLLA